MNQNDKIHGITPPECENNVNELSDDELDSVAGGTGRALGERGIKCQKCRTCFTFPSNRELGVEIAQCPHCHTSNKITTYPKYTLIEIAY